jgi:NAD(P)-dependent dehydrogenase (short-subunit alcohol dehydrogenase family)
VRSAPAPSWLAGSSADAAAGTGVDLGLRGQTVAVVGASGLLGRATALALAGEGARLALLGRDTAALEQLAAEARDRGAEQARAFRCDVADAASTDAAIDAVEREQGPIDVLVASAGAAQGGLFWEITDDAWRANLEAKLFGSIRVLRAVAPRMVARRRGRIVMVVGNTGRQPDPRMLPGAAANAALLAIVRGLAEELGPHGVVVNAVNPGPVRSPRWERLMRAAAEREGRSVDEVESAHLDRAALRRLGTAEEIAQHVLFLASERAGHLTGTSVTVDGGTTKSI